MTSLLEKIVAIIAPHTCISCGKQDNILCDSCIKTEYIPLRAACLLCGTESPGWRVCSRCRPAAALDHIWAAGEYAGVLERIIHSYKFERVREAYAPLGTLMVQMLPRQEWLVVPVPTAPPRIRQRGYDQAALLARYIAASQNNVFSPALLRVQYDRQVGKNRIQRQKQSAHMFCMAAGRNVRGAHILLVDDVCTTGATLNAAARVLRAAGAASVDAVAAAWQPLKG